MINVDFIGVVSLTASGLLEYRRLPITKLFDEQIQFLKAMCDNENRTLMDLQDYFQEFMPKNDYPQGYDYCGPYDYRESYIYLARYPHIYTLDEYKSELNDDEMLVTSNFLQEHNAKNISELSHEQNELLRKELISSKIILKRLIKQNFFKSASRFIQAYRFYKELSIVRNESRNKMFSTENIGWTEFKYSISDDIKFYMKSNFGYGNSSYHFLNLTYKGVDVLPYSALVKYYRVNMVDFYRYTRQYIPTRENWEVALGFVVETANLAIQDKNAFVEKWIRNEIKEMVSGLEIISQQPDKCIDNFFCKSNEVTNLLYVRNTTNFDRNEYLAFPDEITTIFKAEKLSAALLLLDKLQLLAPAHAVASEAIERIKELNFSFYPNLKEYIVKIEQDIKDRKSFLVPKCKDRDQLKEKVKEHYDRIEKLVKNARMNNNFNINQIRMDYLSAHPDVKLIFDDIQKLEQEISFEEGQIKMRENFVRRLEACKMLITSYLSAKP